MSTQKLSRGIDYETSIHNQRPYLAIYIADYIIDLCDQKGIEINNLKLQKIMYYLQARYLTDTGKPLFDESIQKWRYGPVIPSVYHEYKDKGAANIDKKDIGFIVRDPKENEVANFLGCYFEEEYTSEMIIKEDREVIGEVVNALKDYTGFDLVKFTHEQSIWNEYKDKIYAGVKELEYTNDEIEQYFKKNTKERIWNVS
ncbi:Panacea domain-containing protein [Melissococcus plutonius]|uniref:Panacea domain-containing protein n=1 Tax=Melissococcus plutonius TaxID=33970 RepID=UPI00065E0CB0|nr:type II toxin-antitoxin system antitoxin SocA domain-containing protein [Melissococcus plutonius]KMT32021.1 nucleoside diphosphate kinase [Melissococcus plutonius]